MSGDKSPYILKVEQLVLLYQKVKAFVLLAEQWDRESKSNISVFKEQRDAFDHFMRAAARYLQPTHDAETERYIDEQFSKARGHLFRAAYDALDGLAVSMKLRVNDAMKDSTTEAIAQVFKDYYGLLVEVGKVEATIAKHRAAKDIGDDHSQDNLDSYAENVQRLLKIAEQCESHVVPIQQWMAKKKKEDGDAKIAKTKDNLIWKFLVPIGAAIIGAVVTAILT